MSITEDVRAARDRFATYIDQLSGLLKEFNINGKDWYANLKKANDDPAFIARRDSIWKQILEQEGGKLHFGVVLGIVGAVLGGVGIAGAWGAFGLPLVLLLAPAGIWIGNELDDEGLTRKFVKEVGSWFDRFAVSSEKAESVIEGSPTSFRAATVTDADRLRASQERMRARVERHSSESE